MIPPSLQASFDQFGTLFCAFDENAAKILHFINGLADNAETMDPETRAISCDAMKTSLLALASFRRRLKLIDAGFARFEKAFQASDNV